MTPGAPPTERGQAAADYVAVVLVVATALAGVAAVADGAGVAEGVRRQMARALCVAGGGATCEQDRSPCPTGSRRYEKDLSLTIAVLHLAHGRTLVREEHSDGTVTVTASEHARGGVEVGLGAGAHVALGRRALAVGGEAGAAVLAGRGSGRSWVLPDGPTADALVRRLAAERSRRPWRKGLAPQASEPRPLPPPTSTFDDSDLAVTLSAALGQGGGAASAAFTAEDVFGSRVDAADGRRTFFVRRGNEVVGTLDLPGAGASGSAEGSESYAVAVARDGRPLELLVVESGGLTGSADLPTRLQRVAGLLGAPTRLRRAWVAETRLDLTDRANLALARDFFTQVRSPRPRVGDAVRVSRALARRLDEAGIVDARTYETDDHRYGAGARPGAGLRLAADVGASLNTARLIAAATRGIDGAWRRRDDCLPAKRA